MTRVAALRAVGAFCLAAAGLCAAGFPEADISNGPVRAKLYLPDPEKGYYQGTRFDWSGVMPSLKYKGHEYFGQWFDKYDPKIHDAIVGPVEAFQTRGAGLGYEEAPVGGTFIRIGVGIVRKPEEPRYRPFHTYEIVDHGKWRVRKGRDWIEFIHELKDESGYAYLYRKRIALARNRPVMTIDHSLKNTGSKTIETDQYNHNFFVIDGEPTGPDFAVEFPFEVSARRDFNGLAETRGKSLVYLKELPKGQSVYSELDGPGGSASDYDIRIENRKTGAGVRITGDRPISRLVYWSIRTTLCPEPYIDMKIGPGQEFRWKLNYEFYTRPSDR